MAESHLFKISPFSVFLSGLINFEIASEDFLSQNLINFEFVVFNFVCLSVCLFERFERERGKEK